MLINAYELNSLECNQNFFRNALAARKIEKRRKKLMKNVLVNTRRRLKLEKVKDTGRGSERSVIKNI